jgi:BlaI family transcriptional regulator, penicillinase repressor
MGQDLPHITDAELAVLQLLWDHGPSAVRPLADVLYPGGGPSEYATVHRLLERLEAKGYVRRQRTGGVYVFHPARDRDDVLGQQLEALLEKMGGGSLQPLLTNLLRSRRLTPEELRELLVLVDDLDARSRAKNKKRHD